MHTRQLASDIVTDSVFALRAFRRSPGWTFVTLLTIALGVGASAAVFSVADTFLIRPFPYRDASRVYAVSLQGRLQGEAISLPLSPDIVRDWRNSARTIEAAAANTLAGEVIVALCVTVTDGSSALSPSSQA